MEVDPALIDFNYAAESYDAAIVSALAVEEAKTDGSAYANKINGITREGEKCNDWASCLDDRQGRRRRRLRRPVGSARVLGQR